MLQGKLMSQRGTAESADTTLFPLHDSGLGDLTDLYGGRRAADTNANYDLLLRLEDERRRCVVTKPNEPSHIRHLTFDDSTTTICFPTLIYISLETKTSAINSKTSATTTNNYNMKSIESGRSSRGTFGTENVTMRPEKG